MECREYHFLTCIINTKPVKNKIKVLRYTNVNFHNYSKSNKFAKFYLNLFDEMELGALQHQDKFVAK